MRVNLLQLRNFRNYRALDLSFDDGINVFVGDNAQGKTNIVEAIYYASLAKSHRTNTDSELIAWQENRAAFKLSFTRLSVENSLEFQFSREKRRKISLNGEVIAPKDLIGTFNTVLFSPEDLFLIKGAPLARRKFLDAELSQASPAYFSELRNYTKIVSQRNMLLKKIKERSTDTSMLDLWDEQLVNSAVKLWQKRILTVERLNNIASLMQQKISSSLENLAINYEISTKNSSVTSDLASWYNKELRDCRRLDIMRGSTSVGPHHDDLLFTVNGIDLRSFGSQGQQRTGVLALKLSELEFLRAETNEYPVLLLDDVMSELDSSRRAELIEFIRREKIQTFITATEREYFPKNDFGTYYEVEQGMVKRR